MKARLLLFLTMIGAASVGGAGYAAGRTQRAESPSSASREDTGPDRPRDTTKDPQVRDEREERDRGYLDEEQHEMKERARSLPKRRPSHGHPRPTATDSLRFDKTSASRNFQADAHRTGMDSTRTSSPSAGVPDSVVNHSTGSVRPAVAAGRNGHPFKNAHNSGASLAISGGPANPTRGTAVINGTERTRKP